MPIRSLIVDDNRSFLEVARTVLEQDGLNVVGVASTGAEAVRQVQARRPEVVLVDIFLSAESGVELATRIVEAGTAVILISTHAEGDVAAFVSASGAAGFLPKAELSAAAVRRIIDGRSR